MNLDIITITFNNLIELQRTYHSLLSQTSHHFRWIVIDGASTDGSHEWLEKLDTPFSFKWISEPDTGIYNAMNKGITLIHNNGYTIFMNSGDEFHSPDVIFKIGVQLDNYLLSPGQSKPFLVYGDAVNVTPDGSEYLSISRAPGHAIKGMLASHQAMFFNNRLLSIVRYDERYRLSADYDLMCKFIKAGTLFGNAPLRVNIKICRFYLNGVSVLHREKAMKEDYFIRRRIMDATTITACSLYLAHKIHHSLKKYFPNIVFLLRSKKNNRPRFLQYLSRS